MFSARSLRCRSLGRRRLGAGLAALAVAAAMPSAQASAVSFETFLEGVRQEALRQRISAATLNRALRGLQPNARVLELDQRQPEFTLTFEQYRDRTISQTRIDNARRHFADNRTLLQQIAAQYRVSPRPCVAIWGLETNFGANTGGFNVIEALATLAWDGRRSSFFRQELLAALKVLDGGHVSFERMRGSWAGAMGQPQFMPTNFHRLAVDFDGDCRRDIWGSRADALGSIANYLAHFGWQQEEPWGRQVVVPANVTAADIGLDNKRPRDHWVRLGVRRLDGLALPPTDPVEAAILMPDGEGGQAFIVYQNFRVIRRYNPSNYYALAVGLLSDRVA